MPLRKDMEACPFCGNDEIIVGPASAMSRQAICANFECGARLIEGLPERWPEDLPWPEENLSEATEILDSYLDEKVTERWNRRA